MKALSIKQPWAGLIADGYKTIELRTWEPWGNYRGPLAIHASKGSPRKHDLQVLGITLRDVNIGTFEMPRGCIIATCELVDVHIFSHASFSYFKYSHRCDPAYFDFVPYGWVLTNIKKLDIPIPCKGRLGLWETRGRWEI